MNQTDEDYRRAARRIYTSDSLNIDDRAIVSHSDDGAWVAAWVWITTEDAKEPAP